MSLRGNIRRGSYAGLNDAPSTWIAANGTGYANPKNQLARRGMELSNMRRPARVPRFEGRNTSSIVHSMTDKRLPSHRVNLDAELSKLI